MQDYQREFIEFALAHKALLFGEFKLKSGRISPYFFNSGCFNTGYALARLGQFYAQAIQAAGISYDVLFGPAYKGIPLVAAVAVALAEHHSIDKPFAFNRKEVKDHGEGGLIVGAPLQGRVLVIDDVITAGTAINESALLIQQAHAEMAGIVISMDRQERQHGELSSVAEVEQRYGAPVISVIKLENLMAYLEEVGSHQEHLEQIFAYRKNYGVI